MSTSQLKHPASARRASASEQRAISASAEPASKGSYVPSPADEVLVKDQSRRSQARHSAPRIRIERQEGLNVTLAPDHPDPVVWQAALEAAMGTVEPVFANGLLSIVLNACGDTQPVKADAVNFALAAMHGIAPRDEAEAMLAAQMIAVQIAAMGSLQRMQGVQARDAYQCYANVATKLTRTFAAQMEALKRYRSKGEQMVRIEHVNVGPGGQAIVGAVSGAPAGGSSENRGQPHAKQLAYAPEPTMPCPNAERNAMPVARS